MPVSICHECGHHNEGLVYPCARCLGSTEPVLTAKERADLDPAYVREVLEKYLDPEDICVALTRGSREEP